MALEHCFSFGIPGTQDPQSVTKIRIEFVVYVLKYCILPQIIVANTLNKSMILKS